MKRLPIAFVLSTCLCFGQAHANLGSEATSVEQGALTNDEASSGETNSVIDSIVSYHHDLVETGDSEELVRVLIEAGVTKSQLRSYLLYKGHISYSLMTEIEETHGYRVADLGPSEISAIMWIVTYIGFCVATGEKPLS